MVCLSPPASSDYMWSTGGASCRATHSCALYSGGARFGEHTPHGHLFDSDITHGTTTTIAEVSAVMALCTARLSVWYIGRRTTAAPLIWSHKYCPIRRGRNLHLLLLELLSVFYPYIFPFNLRRDLWITQKHKLKQFTGSCSGRGFGCRLRSKWYLIKIMVMVLVEGVKKGVMRGFLVIFKNELSKKKATIKRGLS